MQFGADQGKSYVRRFPKTEFNNKFTLKTIKQRGLRLMLWGCFSWNGVGPLVKIVGNMDATYCVGNILETVMLPYAEKFRYEGFFSKIMTQNTHPKKQRSGSDPSK